MNYFNEQQKVRRCWGISTFFLLTISFLTLSSCQIFPDPKANTKVIQKQNFTNLIIEEGELVRVKFADYFSGSLLKYELLVYNTTTKSPISKAETESFIYISDAIYVMNISQINHISNITWDFWPFSRSSLMVNDQSRQKILMYFIDKNFQFICYDASGFSEGVSEPLYKIPLNTTVVNDECSDITRLTLLMNDNLLIFCKSIRVNDLTGEIQQEQTLIFVENFQDNPHLRYLTYHNTSFIVDAGVQLSLISYDSMTALFLGVAMQEKGQNLTGVLIRVNISEFYEMNETNEDYRFQDVGSIDIKYYFVLPEEYSSKRIIDIKMTKLGIATDTWIAILIQNGGIIYCRFSKFFLFFDSASNQPAYCNETNSYFKSIENAVSISKNDYDGDTLYVALLSPPGVVEINIADPANAYVNNIFMGQDDQNYYFGLPIVASNHEFVIHLMQDMYTQEYCLRVYSKVDTYFDMARADMRFDRLRKPNFVVFPHHWLNIIWLRDEQYVSIMVINDQSLHINASNSLLMQKYLQSTLTTQIRIYNQFDSKTTAFNMTFINKNDTEIYPVYIGETTTLSCNIFYNCGEHLFSYVLADHFNGPNFELMQVNDDPECQDGSCYFQVTSKEMRKMFSQNFTLKNCTHSFFLPYINFTGNDQVKYVMICADRENSVISSYTLCLECQEITLTNMIELPQQKILDLILDNTNRMLIAIVRTVEQEWIDIDMEIHFFTIENQIISQKTVVPTKEVANNNVKTTDYDPVLKRIIMIGHLDDNNTQLYTIFEIDTILKQPLNTRLPVVDGNETMKVQLGSDGFIYTLQADNSLTVYEIQVDGIIYQKRELKKMWYMKFDPSQKLHTFDLIEGQYLILYVGTNQIQIWEIDMKIYWIYKMTLPLYNEYQNYEFVLDERGPKVVRSFQHQYFMVLMQSKDPIFTSNTSYQMFFYQFKGTQHNALLMQENLSSFFNSSLYKNIYLIQGTDLSMIALMTDNITELYQIEIQSKIRATNDTTNILKLHKNCSSIKSQVNDQGLLLDQILEIGSLQIKSFSKFKSSSNKQTQLSSQYDMDLHVFSMNQGLLPTPTQSSKVSYGYNNNALAGTDAQIIMDSLIEGYNMNFSVECTYHDDDGNILDCSKDGITDYTKTKIYNFYLEFVTSQKQVFKSFTLGPLFFMFDTDGYVNVQNLPEHSTDLDLYNGFPLENITSLLEQELFECNITMYADMIRVHRGNDSADYGFLYQCYMNDSLYLRFAQIKVFDYPSSSKDLYQISVFKSMLRMEKNIRDIAVVKVELIAGQLPKIQGRFAVTAEVEGTYSNILYIYDFVSIMILNEIDLKKRGTLSAVNTVRDTFKIGKILTIPDSDLILVALEDSGAIIVDTTSNQVLVEYNINQLNSFKEQTRQQQGSLQVFSIAGDWPHSFHILTNYGLYIYKFNVNLCDRKQIFPEYQKALIPISTRMILIYFDTFSYQLAYNQYGYAFLVTKTQGGGIDFDVYLGVVSFYAHNNNKLFKMIKVTENQNCTSLNQESYLATSQEDQIAVSFICNTQLYVVRACLRPRIIIDMSPFNQSATRKMEENVYSPGIYQFNQFDLKVNGMNEYVLDGYGKNLIDINLEFQIISVSRIISYIYMVIAILIAFSLLMLFLIIQKSKSPQEKINAKDEDPGYLRQLSYSNYKPSFSYSEPNSMYIPKKINLSARKQVTFKDEIGNEKTGINTYQTEDTLTNEKDPTLKSEDDIVLTTEIDDEPFFNQYRPKKTKTLIRKINLKNFD